MSLHSWLAIWVLISMIAVYIRWRRGALGVGLIFSYMVQMWVFHGLGGILYLLPWHDYFEPRLVELGFRQASYGFVALGLGSSLIAPTLIYQFKSRLSGGPPLIPKPQLARIYAAIGLACYFFLLPIAHRLPSATALSSGGWRLLTAGIALGLWKAWQEGNRKKLRLLLLGSSVGLPFLTVVTQGFLGFGSVIVFTLLAFVGSFYRPRWKLVVLGCAIAYLGLSVFVSYMRDRSDIRQAVWGGDSFEERTGRILNTIKNFEWIRPSEMSHLQLIDERLNQNVLVGAGVEYLGAGFVPFAYGETVWQAVLGLVPRVVWPNKPIQAGSGDLVSVYTGIFFEEGTSVGIGQVLEFYINFGTWGVLLGFLILGTFLAIIDSAASQKLLKGDWQGFAYFYLPGLSLIEVGGSLVETASSAAASLLTVYLVNRYLLHKMSSKEVLPSVR